MKTSLSYFIAFVNENMSILLEVCRAGSGEHELTVIISMTAMDQCPVTCSGRAENGPASDTTVSGPASRSSSGTTVSGPLSRTSSSTTISGPASSG